MPRQARLDATETLHYVIVRGIEKRKIFDCRDSTSFVSTNSGYFKNYQ